MISRNTLRPLLIMFFGLISSGLFAQGDSTEKYVFLEYGFSDDDCIEAQLLVNSKWNINFKRVALCEVSEQLEDSVQAFNANTREQLANYYGADWEKRYEKELNEACTKHRIAYEQSLIDSIDRVGADFTERISNNPNFTSLRVQIFHKDTLEKYEPISINNLLDESNTILYRGFSNHFDIKLAHSRIQEFKLECINCTINTNSYRDSLPAGQYFIKPRSNRENLTLNIYSHKELIKSRQFEARNLPDPILFINDVPSGSSLPIEAFDSTLTMDLRYSNEISLTSKFEVVKWEFAINGEHRAWGVGNTIAIKHLEKLTQLNSGDKFALICTAKGPDGIQRKKAAAFVLK